MARSAPKTILSAAKDLVHVLAPKKHGLKDPALLPELFDRIERFVHDVREGTTYGDVTRRCGLEGVGVDSSLPRSA